MASLCWNAHCFMCSCANPEKNGALCSREKEKVQFGNQIHDNHEKNTQSFGFDDWRDQQISMASTVIEKHERTTSPGVILSNAILRFTKRRKDSSNAKLSSMYHCSHSFIPVVSPFLLLRTS
mmetsp:Transcript_8684/g.25711  ORF Transcript_8684/g.25711 Transcript_8684/m.25711 type:complete len:122 (-) Transcript_8684:3574-3939(-)